jgi:nitrile hydratase
MHGFGAVPVADEAVFHDRWEGRVWAMLRAVMAHTTIDRFRYTIERMPPAAYLSASYFERWLWAVETLAAEQGLLDGDERPLPTERPSPAIATWPGRFAAGDLVRVRNAVTDGHTRVPRYLRRHVGRVERLAFAWPNPGESAAAGTYGDPELVYTVTFDGAELFGPASDHTVSADFGESDLEEA